MIKKGHRFKQYGFRQFWRYEEKEIERTKIESGKQREIIIYGYRVKEQIISYKKRKYSTVVYRDSKGKFTKKPKAKVTEKPITGDWFGKTEYYRASVFVEIPYHGKPELGVHNYVWFGIIVIDKLENIKISEMKDDVIQLLEDELHYKKDDFWFDITYSIENPKSYPANRKDRFEEKWSKTKG